MAIEDLPIQCLQCNPPQAVALRNIEAHVDGHFFSALAHQQMKAVEPLLPASIFFRRKERNNGQHS